MNFLWKLVVRLSARIVVWKIVPWDLWIGAHKTAPSLVLVPANATETIRKLDRANRRAR
jgi:hypothetical protein